MTHHLLERQLRKLNLRVDQAPDREAWERFIQLIDRTYSDADSDRTLLERSLAISTEEMQDLYQDLKHISDARYRAIVEGQTEYINRYSLDGTLTFVNQRYADLFGSRPEDMLGKKHSDFLSPEELRALEAVWERLSPDNPTSTTEVCAASPDGKQIWLQWRDTLITSQEGEPIEYQGVGRDITERVLAEEALRESEEKFRTLADKSPNMIFINQDGKVVYANDACVEVMGYTRDEFYADDFDFMILIAPENKDKIRDRFQRHMRGEEVPPYESRLVTKDGQQLQAIHATRIIRFGGRDAILGIVTDVTERMRTEDALRRHATEMAVLNEVGGKIAADLELDSVLQRSVQLIEEHFGYHHIGLFLKDNGGEAFKLTTLSGRFTGLFPEDHALKLGQGLVGWSGKTGETVMVNDVSSDERYVNFCPDRIPTQSELCIPIVVGDRVLGILDVQSEHKNAFNEQDKLVLETLADQIAAAIENARLYETVQRELQERARAEAQMRLQTLALESAANAIVITDRDGAVLWSNKAFTQLTGYATDEIKGQQIGILNSSTEDRSTFKKLWDTILSGETWHGELVNRRRKDGSLYIEEQTITPVLDDDGAVSHFVAIKQDITARREAEERIRQQSDDLRLINSLNSLINQGRDVSEIVEYLSDEIKHTFGSLGITVYLYNERKDRLVSQNLSLPADAIHHLVDLVGLDLTFHELRIESESIFEQVLRNREPFLANKRQDVQRVIDQFIKVIDVPLPMVERLTELIKEKLLEQLSILAVTLIPLVSEGEPIGVIAVGRREPFSQHDLERVKSFASQLTNAIKRKQAQEALQQSEANYRDIFEGVQDAIFVQSMDGQILDVNRRACEMYGWDREQLLQKSVLDLVPEGQPVVLPADLVNRGTPENVLEGLNIRASGETFPVEITTRIQQLDGEQVMLVVIRDVTEARQAQKRAFLQDRLAAVGQLAAGIAHDFNNILGTIILYSELMMESDALAPKERDRLSTIIKQAQRGSTLTAQILDFSRRSVMEMHPIDLVPFLQDMEKLLSRTLPENVSLEIEIAEDAKYIINADPARIQQVIMNMAVNSRDAMPDGGALTFQIGRINVNGINPPYPGMKPDDYVTLQIKDTGHGISPEDIPHIFEPFFTTKPQGKGTGLGLAQVYGIVKQHGGYIDVSSEPGESTTFYIYLPAIELPPRATPIDIKAFPELGAGEHILVVEDDHATRTALCEILESFGYRVSNARDGVEAMDIIEKESGRLDLVVSDLVMPNMGGRELYDHVSSTYPHMKMVLITGYPLGTHTRELLDREKVSWLQKPLSSELVLKTIHDLLKP
ncbi:MAG: PAS domain S-box protein [Anaerolineales bacterium]|nr:PAS domain S-box protein [Anaerolineales bacterium]